MGIKDGLLHFNPGDRVTLSVLHRCHDNACVCRDWELRLLKNPKCTVIKKEVTNRFNDYLIRVDRWRWYHLWRPVRRCMAMDLRDIGVLDQLAEI